MKDGEGKTFCKCGAEFSGRWCENQSHAVDKEFSNENDTCTPNPCQNNGVCSNEGDNLAWQSSKPSLI